MKKVHGNCCRLFFIKIYFCISSKIYKHYLRFMAFSKAFLFASAPNNDVKINLKIKAEFLIYAVTFTTLMKVSMCISLGLPSFFVTL